jgi:hypothetical protein
MCGAAPRRRTPAASSGAPDAVPGPGEIVTLLWPAPGAGLVLPEGGCGFPPGVVPAGQPVRVVAVAGSVWTMTSASSGQRARTASSMSPARRCALGSG